MNNIELKNKLVDRCRLIASRRLRARLKEYLSRKHKNCVNGGANERCGLRKELECTKLLARVCPFFLCKHTKDSVLKDFLDIVDDKGLCSMHIPKLSAYMEVLAWLESGQTETSEVHELLAVR